MAKKQKELVYARNCIHGKEEIYELIRRCEVLSLERGRVTGCHSQYGCEYYNKPYMKCKECGESYGKHKNYCTKKNN